jgi:hypothetical protein
MIPSSGKMTVFSRKSMENGSSTPHRKIAELSSDFRLFPIGKNRNLVGRHRENPKIFRPGILLPWNHWIPPN